MRHLRAAILVPTLLLIPALAGVIAGCGGGNGTGTPAGPSLAFVHFATLANIPVGDPNSTRLDHPLLDGNPNAVILVTQNWNPGGFGGVNNAREIGVWYDGVTDRWYIFNQDTSPLPLGCAFNVRIITGLASTFIHVAAPANITANWTTMTHPMTDGNPGAIILITQNWNPFGAFPGVYNPLAMGLYYTGGQWTIFNENFMIGLEDGSSYNVSARAAGANDYTHIATAGNTLLNSTVLTHPALDGNPNALVQITQNWEPNGIYNDHPVGVWYDGVNWVVFNEDNADIPLNAAFNISVD